MSHEIWDERFYAFREAGWHKLGYVSPERLTAVEAMLKARVDYDITLKPLLVDLGGVQTSLDKCAIVREPTADDPQYRVFGVASCDYTILQNRDIVRLFNPLTEQWPVETMGALSQGKTFFMTLDVGANDVKGDKVHDYFVIDDTRSGGDAFSIFFTRVRVVCANTLRAGKESAVSTANLGHFGNLEAEVSARVTLLKQMEQVRAKMHDAFEALAEATLSEASIERLLAISYPYPRKPKKVTLRDELSEQELAQVRGLAETVAGTERNWTTAKARMDERRSVAMSRVKHLNAEMPHLANTGWVAYNAVVEVEDYRAAEKSEDSLASALFGSRAETKKRAFAAAFALATEDESELVSIERKAR
jgi:phage/plasmid-like protein (TIGR03299 family)